MSLQSVKYLFKTILLTLVFSFLLDKVAFFVLNNMSDKVYTGQSIGKLNHYIKIKDSLDFLVFGSSRSNHSIDPSVITPKSFNMGMDGTKIAYASTLVKLLSDNEQVVLVHIDTENAFNKEYRGKDILDLSKKYHRNEIIKTEIESLEQENLVQKFYWSLAYNGIVLGIVKNYFKPNYNYKAYNGYDPIYVSPIQNKIFENLLREEDSKDFTCSNELILNPLYDRYLNDLKEFSLINNKKLFFFTSPLYDDSCKLDNNLVARIMQSKDLTYFDLTDFFKQNNSLEYWKDNSHISDKGAEIFSAEIKSLVENHN